MAGRLHLDIPLRAKLLLAFLTVPLIIGVLTVVAGGLLIDRLVVGEAQRRVVLGLKTARSTLDERMLETQRSCSALADVLATQPEPGSPSLPPGLLEKLREKYGYDFLHVLDTQGRVIATARGDAQGLLVNHNPVVSAALQEGRAGAGYNLLSARQLAAESPHLAAQAYLPVVDTPRASPGGPTEITEGLALQAAAPIVVPPGRIIGAVHAGVLLNRNYALVDFIRDNGFTHATYKAKHLGTVTVFLRDVRIATNVTDPQGERAIGTRVSAEVFNQVLGRGETWIGPAFVVDSWYYSAYEPIRDPRGEAIGILYVGVLKDRYDDMRAQTVSIFLGLFILALVSTLAVGTWLAGRLSRPISRLTEAASEIERGNLGVRLPEPPTAQYDELKRLTVSFNKMTAALRERDEEIRYSHQELAEAASELRRWNENYLDTLGFITHELKNQIAAMEINLLALRDGYVGELSADQREALEDIVDTVLRTEEMILNYLNLSRIEKGELEVRARPVQVEADVVRPVLRDLRGRFDEKSMTVELDLPEDLVVQADPSLLQMVYENLLSNAAKYGHEGGAVRVWGRRRDGGVELHVRNEGPGVPTDQVAQLFEKFSRLQSSDTKERGTGLGLFITREIVGKHGGRIWAESEAGEWIDFVFTLPRPDVLLSEEEI